MATLIISANTTGDYIGDNANFLDTMIRGYTSYQNTNYGSVTTFEVSNWEVGDINHAILFADLSGLPSGATINSVELRLYCTSRESTAALDLRRLLVAWEEMEATWNIRSTGNNWATPGATGSADRDATILDSFTSALGWMSISGSGLVDFVQDVVDGTLTNRGWHLQDSAGAYYHSHTFRSSEGTDGQRPALIIDYTEGVELAESATATELQTAQKSTTGAMSESVSSEDAQSALKITSAAIVENANAVDVTSTENEYPTFNLGAFSFSETQSLGAFWHDTVQVLGSFERSEYYDLGEFVCLEES